MVWSRLFVTTAFLVSSARAVEDFSTVTVTTTKVAGTVHMLTGRGGNIGVCIGEDGVLLIDDQYAPLADKIREAVARLGGDKPEFVLNTHWHGDHTGGNEAFGETGSVIIAHENVRKRLVEPQQLFGETVDALGKPGWPVVAYAQSLSIHFNKEEIRVQHLPHGHTDGDSVVFFSKSNVVHMGDLMFNGTFPFVDLQHGGDVEGLARNVQAVIDQLHADAKVIPGHGALTDLSGLKVYHTMLVECIECVRGQMKAGKTLGDITTGGVPERWAGWGGGFIKTDQWIATIHESLSRT